MSDPRTTLIEVIRTLTDDSNQIDPNEYLCLYHQERDVRTCIHSMLRMYSCSVFSKGVLSPCFPSKKPKNCEHGLNCSYVLGHCIYLWASMKIQVLHPGEDRGCGCNFYHSQEETQHVREYAFGIMEELYGKYDLLSSPPVFAMKRIHHFYQTLLRRTFPRRELPSKRIPVFNISKKRPSTELVYISNDAIFKPLNERPNVLQETERPDFPCLLIYKDEEDEEEDELLMTSAGMDD